MLATTMVLPFAGCAVPAAGSAAPADSAAVPAGSEANEDAAPAQADAGDAVTVNIWFDNDESMFARLGEAVNEKLAGQNVQVHFEKKSDINNQISMYGTDAQNGPDMYLFAHDSLGSFVEMGILEPVENIIDTGAESDFIPMTLEAASYQGIQYLMPVYYETLLFMYNKELWEGEIPGTTDELLAYMEAHTDPDAGTYAVVNLYNGAYNVAPYFHGFGGYMINADGEPGLNTPEMKEAAAYNKKFAALEANGEYNTITALFNEGKAAAIIGGPWLVAGIKQAGIDLGIKSLTEILLPNGRPLIPYSGVQSLGVLKVAAEHKRDAIKKVLEVFTDPDIGTMLANEYNCAPVNSLAYQDPDVAANEMVMAMQKSAEEAIPMPNIPEITAMWVPSENFFTAVNVNGMDIDAAAEKYQEEALSAIADMH